MSAWIATDKHIASIAVAFFPPENAQQMANDMKRANIDSVNYRYDKKKHRTKCSLKQAEKLLLQDLYSLTASLDYQSCEVPDYEHTPMAALMKMILVECEEKAERFGVPLRSGKHNELLGKWSI